MWGSTTLGEYYADAVLDIHGPEWAREHLISLWKDGAELDEPAKAAVLSLIKELSKENQAHLSHYNDHSYVLPRLFANSKDSTLIGYSERIYYAERELQLTPGQYPPIVKPDEIVIRQFSFAEKSQGTPCWTDAFIIPKGRLSKKRAAIADFFCSLFRRTPRTQSLLNPRNSTRRAICFLQQRKPIKPIRRL